MFQVPAKKIIIYVILGIVLIAGGYFVTVYYFNYYKVAHAPKTDPVSDNPTRGSSINPDPQIFITLQETPITLDRLPEDLSNLILPTSREVRPSIVVFVDQTSGYKITYIYDGNLPNTLLRLLSFSPTKYGNLEGNYDDSTSTVFIEKSGTIYKIELTANTPQTIGIMVISRNK